MNVGDVVLVKSELEQGHIEGYEILRAFVDTDDDGDFFRPNDGVRPAYDWWLSMPTHDKTHNLELPYRESELTDDADFYMNPRNGRE